MYTIIGTAVKVKRYNPVCGYDAWENHYFELHTNHRGEKECYVDDKLVTKDEGNDFYKELKSYSTFEVISKVTRDYTYDELIKNYSDSVDQYTDYIENYQQQLAAEEHNSWLYSRIEKFRKLKEDYENEAH